MEEPKVRIPSAAVPREELLERMRALRGEDVRWEDARIFSLVYNAAREHTEFLKECYNLFSQSNALSPMAFPSLRKFENEVIAMTADMLGGGETATGTMTSGGTESILLAVKTYRDRARAERPEITQPEMVLPITAHPAFMKAAHYFDVKTVHVPITEAYRVDVGAAGEAVGPNTVLLVGSAPPYPHGVIDPIPELAAIAREHGIGMHVDACVGGFMLPWLRKLGHPLPDFDFGVEGVTSISADLHKYGYAARGASTILWRDAEWRKHQFYVYTGWPGGYYAAPSVPGSRPGALVAAAWGTLMSLGEEGYVRLARITLDATRSLMDGINAIPELRVVGEPHMTIFCFGSDTLDPWAIGDAMEGRGWTLERQTSPPSLHMVVTPAHAAVVEPFLDDLRAAVQEVKDNPSASSGGMAAIYGMMAQIPEEGQLEDMILGFLDEQYRC